MRDRRFESVRRKLHYRLKVMQYEHEAHRRAMHPENYYACHPLRCEESKLFREREKMLCEIIREFGGRA